MAFPDALVLGLCAAISRWRMGHSTTARRSKTLAFVHLLQVSSAAVEDLSEAWNGVALECVLVPCSVWFEPFAICTSPLVDGTLLCDSMCGTLCACNPRVSVPLHFRLCDSCQPHGPPPSAPLATACVVRFETALPTPLTVACGVLPCEHVPSFKETVEKIMSTVFKSIREKVPEGVAPGRWAELTERYWPLPKAKGQPTSATTCSLPAGMGGKNSVVPFAPCTFMFFLCAKHVASGDVATTTKSFDSRGSFALLQYAIQCCLGSSRWIQLKGILRAAEVLKAPYSLLEVWHMH